MSAKMVDWRAAADQLEEHLLATGGLRPDGAESPAAVAGLTRTAAWPSQRPQEPGMGRGAATIVAGGGRFVPLDSLGGLRAAIVATAPVAVPALAATRLAHARFAVEASELGWPPGTRVPRTLTTDLGNCTEFVLDSADRRDGEVVGWRYKQRRQGSKLGCYLLVIND